MLFIDILKSVTKFCTETLAFPSHLKNKTICMDDGHKYKIFRQIHLSKNSSNAIYIVRVQFKKFTHKRNIKLSRIPMFMIAGLPGFFKKVWLIDYENNYWLGAYEWKNLQTIERYRKSTVLGIMNKRAISNSISETIIKNMTLTEYLKQCISDD